MTHNCDLCSQFLSWMKFIHPRDSCVKPYSESITCCFSWQKLLQQQTIFCGLTADVSPHECVLMNVIMQRMWQLHSSKQPMTNHMPHYNPAWKLKNLKVRDRDWGSEMGMRTELHLCSINIPEQITPYFPPQQHLKSLNKTSSKSTEQWCTRPQVFSGAKG